LEKTPVPIYFRRNRKPLLDIRTGRQFSGKFMIAKAPYQEFFKKFKKRINYGINLSMASASPNDVNIFVSYSSKDKDLMNELLVQLKVLTISNKNLNIWHDGLLEPGVLWDKSIKDALHSAHIVLMLVSANFLITDYIWNIEVQSALEKQKKDELTVIPIIMKPCDWESTIISEFQALPRKGVPVSTSPDRDTVLAAITKELKAVIQNWSKKLMAN
jgi:hypothetical protein